MAREFKILTKLYHESEWVCVSFVKESSKGANLSPFKVLQNRNFSKNLWCENITIYIIFTCTGCADTEFSDWFTTLRGWAAVCCTSLCSLQRPYQLQVRSFVNFHYLQLTFVSRDWAMDCIVLGLFVCL